MKKKSMKLLMLSCVITSSFASIGCGKGDNETSGMAGLDAALKSKVWATPCSSSSRNTYDFNKNVAVKTTYAKSDCTNPVSLETYSMTYTIVRPSPVVSGAYEFNYKVEGQNMGYDLIKIDGGKLFMGDSSDGKDGTSSENRPVKLSTTPTAS